MKQATLERWTDRVLLPAIYGQSGSSTLQHYPANYQHGQLASQAKNVESHAVLDKSGSRHQLIHHFLQPEVLEEVWNVILHTTEEPGMEDFRDVQLFMNGKNLKVLTKSQTWRGVWEPFFHPMESNHRPRAPGRTQTWIDLGKETCASPSFLGHQDAGGQEAETYLWRPCCLESYWRWSFHGSPEKKSLRTQYLVGLLRDAVGMTILTSSSSPSRQQGLVYSQFYHSQKEIFDANKTYPFVDQFLESLALDPKLRSSWQSVAGSHNHRLTTLLQSYLHSKARCAAGLKASMQKSFGVREEHRMTLALARRLRERLQAMGMWDVVIPGTSEPKPYRSFPTRVFLNFIYLSINRCTTGFEYVYGLKAKHFVSWEHTKIMIMFLRLLKFSYSSSLLRKESALWWDQRIRPNGKRYEGLGFSQTIPEYGYGWYLDKIDWSQFTFQPEITDHVLFGNIHMAEAYRKRWREVKEVTDDFLKVDRIGRWLEAYGKCRKIRDYLLHFLVQICVGHFRKDVLGSIKSSIREEYRVAAIRGEFMLCQHDLSRILEPGTETVKRFGWFEEIRWRSRSCGILSTFSGTTRTGGNGDTGRIKDIECSINAASK